MQATDARAVAELQAQVVAAVAPPAALGLADEEHLVDLGAVGELVQGHAAKVEMAADRTSERSARAPRA